ncbi:hypothetical protein C8T65DRAFT_673250 [Cerioporus squamosus]|nr:hypothetical protein C8T65DRAFT_673250 [Cerioporus squamosus]
MDVASSLHVNAALSQLIPEQVPTPPPSPPSSPTPTACIPQSPDDVASDAIVSISRTFHPNSELLPPQPDTIFSSSDSVLFCVHRSIIQKKSMNDWNNRLPQLPASTYSNADGSMNKVISLPEPAPVLNVVLHAIYAISCAPYDPSMNDISDAVDAMATYGIPPKDHILPSTALHAIILSHAHLIPLAAYTLVASHDILSLAVPNLHSPAVVSPQVPLGLHRTQDGAYILEATLLPTL